jgi:preprotein translocase subunit Sss1
MCSKESRLNDSPVIALDAKTFQRPLASLAETVAYKVEREGPALIKPVFAAADINAMLRQAWSIYGVLFFVNADEHRQGGGWKVGYPAALLPLIRCLIDILYNVTAILIDPGPNAYRYREAGYKRTLDAWQDIQERYAGKPDWDEYIARNRKGILDGMRMDAVTIDEVESAGRWPTLGEYLRSSRPLTPHQEFLKRLTFGFWKEYSAIAHATFKGLLPTAIFHMAHAVPHEQREHFDRVAVEDLIASHLARASGLLICIVTEIQGYFRFEGANINQRIHQVWDALLAMPDIKELFDERYAKLMSDRGI